MVVSSSAAEETKLDDQSAHAPSTEVAEPGGAGPKSVGSSEPCGAGQTEVSAKAAELAKRWQRTALGGRSVDADLTRTASFKALKVLGLKEMPEDHYYNTWEQDMQDANAACNEPDSSPEGPVREGGKQRWHRSAYVAFVVVTYLIIILGVQFWAVWMWPRTEMYLPVSKLEPTSKIHERIAERNVPPLQGSRPDFARLGIEVLQPSNASRDCITPWRDDLFARLTGRSNGTNLTDPEKILSVLQHMRLDNVQEARSAVHDLLVQPMPYAQFLTEISACAQANVPLNAFACEALDEPHAEPPEGPARRRPILHNDDEIVASELWDALHLGLVLERITTVMRDDPTVRAALTWAISLRFQETIDSIHEENRLWAVANGVHGTQRESDVLSFKLDKYQSVLEFDREYKLLGVKKNDPRAIVKMQDLLALNIIEAAHVDLRQGLSDNVAVGVALAVHAQGTIPYMAAGDGRLRFPFGKQWVDSYNAWNMAFVSQFNDFQFFPKLLIPSVQCTDSSYQHRAELFFAARGPSLKLFMLYQTFRSTSRQTRYNVVAFPDNVRAAFGRSVLGHSQLLPPVEHNIGSPTNMFERLLPPSGHEGWTFTNHLDDIPFRIYGALAIWLAVVSAGLGAEFVLGPWLVAKLSSSQGESSAGPMLWKLAQCFFAVNLTVALFSHSALGLPYLIIGLWKGGFPETYMALRLAYTRTRQAGCVTPRAVAFFANGMGFLVHHTVTAFIIICVMTHLFPLDRVVIATCIVPILQHVIVLLKYQSKDLFTALTLFLEVWFEVEVLVNIWPTSTGSVARFSILPNLTQSAPNLPVARFGRQILNLIQSPPISPQSPRRR